MTTSVPPLDGAFTGTGLRPGAAGVTEVGGLAAEFLDEIDRQHHQARPIARDSDIPVELDVGQAHLARPGLGRALVAGVGGESPFRVSAEGVVVDVELGIQRQKLA